MKKQTKIAAVVSATALLAIGASFTSMAATYEWKTDEAGESVCYDADGELYTEAWAQYAGDKYFMDEDGHIVKDSWIEGEDDELFYVDEEGKMIKNNWKQTLAYEADEDEDMFYFYFGADGELDTQRRIAWQDSYYYVDDEGKMLTGWVEYNKSAEGTVCKPADENTARADLIYCNEDGSRAADKWLHDFGPAITEEEAEDLGLDEDDLNWYYIKANGAVQTGRNADINGETYFFDSAVDGHMLTGWVKKTANQNVYTEFDGKLGTDADYKEVFFCGGKNEGWVKKDRWVETFKPEEYANGDADIHDEYWYWISKEGYVFIPSAEKATDANAVTLVNGYGVGSYTLGDLIQVQEQEINKKTYIFNAEGQMLHGLLEVGSNDERFYYGKDTDGSKKYGIQSIKDSSDDAYTFYFAESDKYGETKGAAINGVESKILYRNGLIQVAEDSTVCELVTVGDYNYVIDENGKVQTSTRTKFEIKGESDLQKLTFNTGVTGRAKYSIAALVPQPEED